MNKEAFRIYAIMHLLELFKYEFEFIDKKNIQSEVYRRLNEIRNMSNAFKLDLKKRQPEFNEIFQDLSNDKIFSMMSVMYKMFEMSEQQCLEFENSLEIEYKC